MTKKSLEKEIDGLLTSKVNAVIEKFQAERDHDLHDLAELRANLDGLEVRKGSLQSEQSKLSPIVNKEIARRNEIDRELHKIARTIAGDRKKIDALMARLTAIPEFENISLILNFLSNWSGLKKEMNDEI